MAPLPVLREFALPPRRRRAPLGLVGGTVAALAAVAAGLVALLLAAAVAFAALLTAAVALLAFLAWRLKRGRGHAAAGWREAKVGPAWVGYHWGERGPARPG